jgi:hypothetical protein
LGPACAGTTFMGAGKTFMGAGTTFMAGHDVYVQVDSVSGRLMRLRPMCLAR